MFTKFKKQVEKELPEINTKRIYNFCLDKVTTNPNEYKEEYTGIFLNSDLSVDLENAFPEFAEIYNDGYETIADVLAMFFTFAYCVEDGYDYYLPE